MSGTGTLGHRFLITESGAYAAYVENCSKTAMKVTGTAAFSQEHAAEPMDTGRKDTASAEMTSACGFRLTGKEEHGVGIQRQGILLGADNVLEMTVECPLLGEDEKKMALQIFIDYQQVPFAVDGNIYDTYYMEAKEDFSTTKKLVLAGDFDRSVDHKITALLWNDLQVPGERVRVCYHLSGSQKPQKTLVFLTIGQRQAAVNDKAFLLFEKTMPNQVLCGELEMTAPDEPGEYDVSAWVVYDPYGESGEQTAAGNMEGSPRFKLCVEK